MVRLRESLECGVAGEEERNRSFQPAKSYDKPLSTRETAATQTQEHDDGTKHTESDERKESPVDHVFAGDARGEHRAEQTEQHGLSRRRNRFRDRMLRAILFRPAVCEEQSGNVDGEEAASVCNGRRGSDHDDHDEDCNRLEGVLEPRGCP